MENPSVFEVFINYFSGGAQRAPKIDFGRLLGPFGSPLGTFFEHVGGSVALLGHPLGPKWSQKHQDEGLLGSGRGARGAQRLSVFDFETIFIICCVLFGIFVCLFGKKGFVHSLWYLDLEFWCVFFHVSISAWHFNMVAASHCILQLLF